MAEDARLRAVVGLAQEMAAVHSSPRAGGRESPLSEAAHAAAAGARAALDGTFASVSAWDPARRRHRVLAQVGEPPAGHAAHVAAGGVRAGDVGADGVSAGGREVAAQIVVQGRPWGELRVFRGAGEPPFVPADGEFATVLASVIAAGIAQTEQLEEVHRLAFSDPLTGLANRRAVDARLEEGMAEHRDEGAVVSLVVCDINGLKRINDEYGHDAGDRLLARFGTVLSMCAAELPGVLAARLGGDEFCLLAVGPPADAVVRAAEDVCRRAGGLELGEGVACGVASTGDPVGPVRSARRLFRLADAAQYRAKAARARKPVVAGRDAGDPAGDPVVRLADTPAPPHADRRRFRDG